MAEPSHDANGPYVPIEHHDYEDLKSTKAQLNKARQEVERRYEDLSKCRLDNMTYAKAQLDQARQAEQFRFENFERVHNRLVDSISRLVTAGGSTATRSTDEPADDSDVSSLGPLPRVRPRRIRVPTRVHVDSSRRINRQTRARGSAAAPVRQSRDPVILLLASRAAESVEFKALLKIVAAGSANQDQARIFQAHIDELTAQLNVDQAESAIRVEPEHIEHMVAITIDIKHDIYSRVQGLCSSALSFQAAR